MFTVTAWSAQLWTLPIERSSIPEPLTWSGGASGAGAWAISTRQTTYRA